jgi:hypothetical protein
VTSGDEPTERTSIGGLVSQMMADVSALVRLELELARTELSEQAKQGVTGFALFLLAGFLAFMAGLLASFAAVYGFAQVMPVWAAFLVVAGIYLLLGALLVFIGVRRLKQVRGPERAKHQFELTKQALAPKP